MIRVNELLQRYKSIHDRDMKNILSSGIDKQIQDNSIPLLMSQPICRPSSLNYLIHLYNKQKNPSKEQLKETMTQSLIAFIKYPHDPNQSENSIMRTIGILRRNGADPNYKDQDGKSAFDYAYIDGKILMLETLLCTYSRNPIRIIKTMLTNEKEHDKRPEMLNLLRDIKRDFSTERGFSQYRTLYKMMPIEPSNIP